MDVEKLAKELILKNMTPEQQMAVLEGIKSTVAEAKEVQKRKIGENVDIVVQALKKIEADIRSRYDDVGNAIEKRVASIKDGRDGINGKDGRDGKDGKAGRDGAKGDKGDAGRDGRDGVDGVDGVSVTSARIDFDGSLVIVLSSGVELNVGEVVAPDLAERIKVITNGGGTSQSVLDTLASLQTQINNLIPSQTGNAGKFLTTNGTSTSWASVAGGLSYQGTWNASTNTPTLASSTGINGYYYIVATAGSTNLNGITDWAIGDWLLFNGTVWQKIDQSETLQFVTSNDASVTVTTTGSTADLAVYSSPRLITQVRNETGATLTKGTVVYINGASGNKATVTKALATGDTTSAQTLGLILADISTNNNGYVILSGDIVGLDTSAFAAGTQLYLSSSTAGTYTSTKQYAPNHLVYVGVVTRSHVNQGSIEVRIQNGYEMDELHNVSAQNATNGQVLIYNETTDLWEKNTLTDGTGITITEGAGSITIANSGVTSAVAGTGISVSGATGAVTITNSAPDQTVVLTAGTGISTSGTYPNFTITNSAPDQTVALTGAGTTSVTGTYPNFTITSNDQYSGTVTSITAGTGLTGGTITTSGTVALATSGVTAASYTAANITVDAYGRITSASNGTAGAGFRNRIINGQMQIAQRATSATITAGSTIAAGYSTIDRFYVYCTGANVTAAQVAGSGAIKNNLQITGAASVTAVGIGQRIEQLNSYDMAGSTATLSVNISNSLLTTVTWTAYYATTADTFGTLASPTRTQIATGTFTVNSTLTNYSTQISIPSAATTGIEIVFTVGAQTSGTWVIGNVQLEKGSTATSFDYRPYGTELALCQRYFTKSFATSVVPANSTAAPYEGVGASFIGGYFSSNFVAFPVTMRAVPTMTYFSSPNGTPTNDRWQIYDGGWANASSLNGSNITVNGFQNSWVYGSATLKGAYYISGHFTASIEL